MKVHEPMLKAMVASNYYVKENIWLVLTSWIMRIAFAINVQTYRWIIMDLQSEDPRGKLNAFRVPVYWSPEWKKMIDLATINTKEIIRKDTTSNEES